MKKYLFVISLLIIHNLGFNQNSAKCKFGAELLTAGNLQFGSQPGSLLNNLLKVNYDLGAKIFLSNKKYEFGVGMDYFSQNYKFSPTIYEEEFTGVTFNASGFKPTAFIRKFIQIGTYNFQLGVNFSPHIVTKEELNLYGTNPSTTSFDQFTYENKLRFFYSIGLESTFPLIKYHIFSLGLQFQLSYLMNNKLFIYLDDRAIIKANGMNAQAGLLFKFH